MALRAGFVGLGNIGRPMAERLVAGGLATTVHDLAPEAARALAEKGAQTADSPRALAAACDVVGVCVRDDADVRAVALGELGLLAGAAHGCVVALHSTILPGTAREVGAAAAERGVSVLDAPVTGGAAGARAGALTVMVGGDAEAVERARPFLECFAKLVVHTGNLGSGAITKLCNNLMTYLGFAAAFEANLLAKEAGLDLASLDAVLTSNGNLNDQRRAFLALHRDGPDPGDPGFQGYLRGMTELAEKDLAVTLAFAREQGVALPATGLCAQIMARVYRLSDERRR